MFPVAEGGNGAKGTLTAPLLLETNENRLDSLSVRLYSWDP